MTRCHLDEKRICGTSCIAFDYREGCRLKSNGYARPTRTTIYKEDEKTEQIDLKEL